MQELLYSDFVCSSAEGSPEVRECGQLSTIYPKSSKDDIKYSIFIVYCSFFYRVVQLAPDLQTEEEKPDKMWVLCRVGTTGILTHFKGLHHEIYKDRE
jgi:hypothetical protein